MFSLRRLFGKQDHLFDLLKQAAEEGGRSVKALAKFVEAADSARNLDELVVSRLREKRVFDQIHELLAGSFEIGIQREDVAALSLSLYRIPKLVQRVAERMNSCPKMLHGADFKRQMTMLDRATEILVQMVETLSEGMNLETVKRYNDELQKIEGDADKLVLEVLRDLYSGNREELAVVFLKDLFEMLEKVFDRCRDAGNVITQIILKNS